MATRQKNIEFNSSGKSGLLHIETAGCVVNIRTGLIDRDGNYATSIEILADQYQGEEWDIPDEAVLLKSVSVRVVKRAGGDA